MNLCATNFSVKRPSHDIYFKHFLSILAWNQRIDIKGCQKINLYILVEFLHICFTYMQVFSIAFDYHCRLLYIVSYNNLNLKFKYVGGGEIS